MWSILWPVYVPLTILHGSVAVLENERRPRSLTEVLTANLHHPQYASKIPFWLHPDVSFDCKRPGYFGDPHNCKQFYQCVTVLPGHFVRNVFKCNENRVYSIEHASCVEPEENDRPECIDQPAQAPVSYPPVNALGAADSVPDLSSEQLSPDESRPTKEQDDVDANLEPVDSDREQKNENDETSPLIDPADVGGSPSALLRFDVKAVPNAKPALPVKHKIQGKEHGTSRLDAQHLELPRPSSSSMLGRNSASIRQQYPTSLDYLEENTVGTTEMSGQGTTVRNIEDERVTAVVNDTSTFLDRIDTNIRTLSFTTDLPLPFYPPTEFESVSDTDTNTDTDTDTDTDSDSDADYDCDENTESCDDDTTFRQDEDTELPTTSTTTITASYAVPVMNNENKDNEVACVEEGFFSDTDNCTIFYRCVPFGYSFVKHRFSCPSGTIWDSRQQTCNFPANVERAYACKYETYFVSTSNVVHFPSISVKNDSHAVDRLTGDRLSFACPTGFRRHPKYCNAFYQCTVNDRLEVNFVPFACPSGTIFDEEQIQCEKNDTATTDCAAYQLDEKPDSIRVIKLRGLGKFCTEEGQFPYGEICPTNYFKCVRDERGSLSGYLLDCPLGQLFSPAANGCVSIATFPFCARRYMPFRLNSRLPAP